MTPLRVGLVGFGLAGRVFHGPLLDADPRFRIAAIVTGDPGRRSQAETLHPDATVVGDADAMLGIGLDLVVVASPPATHVPLAQRCLDAGLPVVVDKPFCPTAAQAEELCERADRLGLMLTVFQNRRWDSDFLTLQRLVESGALGDVRRFESRFERWKPADTKAWRVADPAEAGGVVYDLGTHLVDQAIHLFGPVVDMHGELTSHGGTAAPDDGFLPAACPRRAVAPVRQLGRGTGRATLPRARLGVGVHQLGARRTGDAVGGRSPARRRRVRRDRPGPLAHRRARRRDEKGRAVDGPLRRLLRRRRAGRAGGGCPTGRPA